MHSDAASTVGESSAIETLIEEAGPRLAAIVRAFDIPDADAEDLLQEALLTFLLKAPEIRSPVDWLAQAMRLRCRQYLRTAKRHRMEPLEAALAAVADGGMAERALRRIDVERGLRALPPRSRQVLRLRFWCDCRAEEIAARSGYAVGSVDTSQRRAMATLRRRLE